MSEILTGLCEQILPTLAENSFDACVTDPPYGLKFMNKAWDYQVPPVATWKEIYRVLKPGAHMLVACGTRTQHRMAVNIEDAGFEIRDVITWHYGSGFPKNMDISKQIDKQAGAERNVTGKKNHPTLKNKNLIDRKGAGGFHGENPIKDEWPITEPATEPAKAWAGWGTALKPATEFWTLARKPFSKTIAENILTHGTGGINIDACRIALNGETPPSGSAKRVFVNNDFADLDFYGNNNYTSPLGRYPANVIFDEFTGEILDKQAPDTGAFFPVTNRASQKTSGIYNEFASETEAGQSYYNDSGGASRFFYCPKADTAERNTGMTGRHNDHPTIKPIDLMRYLVKLITPPAGKLLDPFCGSGTTLIAAALENKSYTGIEMDAKNAETARMRIHGHLGIFGT